ncbi:cytochrome c-type biogenesis protein CcsB [Blastococcus aurantiacus]|uniref:Cytochrome c-type biogenesis protein CcsB n=1 Tax=Blastococcus aurantiacus TaxID=1550231 RepID=A0A1G7R9G2_9ACTN|nr:c-type cytochrome biogenesis protein CcsB [Blastococcus aurantiacus]SDG07441.1 cytochrome c-type biogenesis protein CcsB [Blastococcus aurantiacus]
MTSDQLSTLSDTLFTTSVVIYAVAALAFCAELAFGRTGVRPRNEPAMVGAGVGQVGDAEPASAPSAAGPGGRWGLLGVLLTGIGALANAGVLVARGLASGRVPWGNMYEFGTAAVLAGALAYLFFAVRVPAIRRIGVFVLGIVVIGMVLIGLYLYAESGPLIAALRSDWLVVHVSAAIISFGIFLVSAVASALYLVALRWRKSPSDGEPNAGGLVESLPSSAVLDRVAHRAAVFGFPIWTFAVIAGAIWAESAWGRFWGWDPKETWAFISWALYAAYLHARTTAGWRGARAAWVNLVAFATLVFNLLFVNLVSAGLHSYGGVS